MEERQIAVDLNVYKKKKNHVTYLMNRLRQEFYSTFTEENNHNQRKFIGAAKSLLGVKDELCFPDHLEKAILANDIAGYFTRKVEFIRNDIDSIYVNLSE